MVFGSMENKIIMRTDWMDWNKPQILFRNPAKIISSETNLKTNRKKKEIENSDSAHGWQNIEFKYLIR